MGKNGFDKKYELVIILDARLSSEEKESVLKEVADLIVKTGGKVINSHVWLERHKLTFAIKKCKEGTYAIINFEGPASAVNQMNTHLRISERIIRFAFIKQEAKQPQVSAKI